MDWKIEKHGNEYLVQAYDLDGTPFIDREVKTFQEACVLVDEVRFGTGKQVNHCISNKKR